MPDDLFDELMFNRDAIEKATTLTAAVIGNDSRLVSDYLDELKTWVFGDEDTDPEVVARRFVSSLGALALVAGKVCIQCAASVEAIKAIGRGDDEAEIKTDSPEVQLTANHLLGEAVKLIGPADG